MSDEERKDDDVQPDDLRRTLNDLFGKMQGMSFHGPGMESPAAAEPPAEEARRGTDLVFDFDYLPRDIKAHLDRFVIRQDEAKKALSIAVCDHYNHARYLRALEEENEGKLPEGIELQKQNVIVVGPTGVGKTYLVKHIAELIGVPFVKADATKFSETGYVGGDVDDLVRELVQKAEGDVNLAEFGIIYIDEIDKIATKGEMIGRDVSGRGVQTTLLKLMEETEVPLSNPMDIRGQMKAMMSMQRGGGSAKESINTRHILFIVSGAFSGLEKVVRRRLSEGQIGFGADPTERPMDEELFTQVETQDFLEFGFEAEFIGRLPVRVVCEKLTAQDLENIMKYSEGSLLRQYEREFEAYGIDATFENSAITKIAELAETEKTGARALMTVCERLLRDFKFELPGTSVTELKIDGELLEQRDERLASYRELGKQVDVARARRALDTFCRDFRKQHGVELVFSDEALARLAEQAAEQGRSLLQLCRQRFRDVQFGLKLIQKNTGQERFELGVEAVDEPDKYLSDLVVRSYRGAAGGAEGAPGEVPAP
ncbi:MAG: AAA domain-containing protein [Akkermansiaceae bacterium]|nr:AAA domain-containing protein [Akkermansiaceae bacterium]NNM28674.1 AAA domain-containing protein [Akkermansiaceae bacterium]